MSGFDSRKLFDALAPFYESHWGRAFLEHSIRLFRRKLAPQLKPGDLVLELCCGTGHFAQWLAEQGYRVTGIDGSRAMLGYARKRSRRASFFRPMSVISTSVTGPMLLFAFTTVSTSFSIQSRFGGC